MIRIFYHYIIRLVKYLLTILYRSWMHHVQLFHCFTMYGCSRLTC